MNKSCSQDHDRAELARDSILEESSDIRSHLLRQIPVDDGVNSLQLEAVDEIDFDKYLSVLSTCRGHLSATSSAVAILETLETSFPSLPSTTSLLPPAVARCRKQDLHRLALDLSLSTVVVSSEDLSPSTVRPPRDEMSLASDNPEDMFDKAASLSLSDRGTPLINFSLLQPRLIDVDGNPAGGPEDGDANVPDLQHPTARFLMADWTIGSSVKDHRWKSWLEHDNVGSQSTLNRPIRPLPSPRLRQGGEFSQSQSYPSVTQMQSTFNRVPSVTASQPRLFHPQPLRTTSSVPQIQIRHQTPSPSSRIQHHHQSSPPLRPSSTSQLQSLSQSQEILFPQTQVERGPFGGRLGGDGSKARKKVVKKRVGGF